MEINKIDGYMNLLLVEDNEMQQQDFIEASEDIAKKNNIVINLIACSNLNEANPILVIC